MKISNFKTIKEVSEDSLSSVSIGEIDIETGSLWWKKKKRVTIIKQFDNWFFADSVAFIPDYTVERLERAERAKGLIKGGEE